MKRIQLQFCRIDFSYPQLTPRPLKCTLFSKRNVSITRYHTIQSFGIPSIIFQIIWSVIMCTQWDSVLSDCSGRHHKVNDRNVVWWLKCPVRGKKRIDSHEWIYRSTFTVNSNYVPSSLIARFCSIATEANSFVLTAQLVCGLAS